MGIEAKENKIEPLRLYNLSQLFLIRYQIATGLIKDPEEYITNGTADMFELIANLHVTLETPDWMALRAELESMTGATNKAVTNQINK